MGRKLRAEFKKALKPGEKEAIERTKALKRMRSAQLLAAGANPSSFFGGGAMGGGPPPSGWNRREASAPGGYGGWGDHDTEDYGRQIHNGAYGGGGGTFGRRDFLHAPPVPPLPSYVPPPPPPEMSYSSSSPPTTSADGSDVGTSVSLRMERESSEGGSDEGAGAKGEFRLSRRLRLSAALAPQCWCIGTDGRSWRPTLTLACAHRA